MGRYRFVISVQCATSCVYAYEFIWVSGDFAKTKILNPKAYIFLFGILRFRENSTGGSQATQNRFFVICVAIEMVTPLATTPMA